MQAIADFWNFLVHGRKPGDRPVHDIVKAVRELDAQTRWEVESLPLDVAAPPGWEPFSTGVVNCLVFVYYRRRAP